MIGIRRTNCNFERESLAAPFGFKGKYVDELWQVAALMESDTGNQAVGLGVQSVLWSDSNVFSRYSQAAGNSAMFLITQYALKEATKCQWENPIELMNQIFPSVLDYAKTICPVDALKVTFVLNALVAVDNAAWLLYSKEKGIYGFEEMLPNEYRPVMSCCHEELACIPLISYGCDENAIREIIKEGFCILKVKIGSDPDGDGDREKMLKWDKQRLKEVHEAARGMKTSYTQNGTLMYYLDANGRYDSMDRVMRLMDYADKIDALDRILILEEPFEEGSQINVGDIPVSVAADESAHTDRHVRNLIELGYGAVALKPIAKTLSMSLKIAKIAAQSEIPCFCADLTVNPILVDWNKNFAARLSPMPGMKIGMLETNGHQNYRRWDKLITYHPRCNAKWLKIKGGIFELKEDFYSSSGGIFDRSEHYDSLVR